jgi:hypothetical protein
MGRRKDFDKIVPSIEKIKETLIKCGGYQAKTAKVLDVSGGWLSEKINSTQELKDLRDELLELKIDIAEEVLEQRIREKSDTCLIFFLKTKAKHRGYSQEILTENNLSAIKEYLKEQKT